MTCPTKRKCQRHLANTLKELSHRLVTFETFDQTDDKTWHFQNRQWQWQLQLENTLKDQSERLVTFETLITFLAIESNNLNIHSYPWMKSDRDSIRNSCDVFLKMQYISIASPQQHPSPWLCSWQCSSRPLQWGGTCRWCTPSGSPQTPAKCPRWRNQDWKSSVFNVCLDV